jgi:hypothetical protein
MTPATDLIDRLEYVAMPDQFGAVGPHAHLCREAAAALRALEARVRELEAEKLSPPQTYPQWGLTGNGDPVRIDHDGCVWFGTGMRVLPGSRWVGTFCSREQAVARLAEILRDPVVAAEGYGASVSWRWLCRSGESELRMEWMWRVWNKDQCREEASGTADTEPAARKELAGRLLDNTMKETKR